MEKGCKSLEPGRKETATTHSLVFDLVLFLIRNPLYLKTYLRSPEDLGKVTCNWLGRMSLPLGTKGGSFGADESFSLRQRSTSLP